MPTVEAGYSSATQSCLLDGDEEDRLYPDNAQSIECRYSSLEIKESSRSLNLKDSKVYDQRKDTELLEVIAGHSNEIKSITVKLIGGVGPCLEHDNNLIVSSTALSQTIYKSGNTSFEGKSLPVDSFFTRLWPKSCPTATYRVHGKTCGKTIAGNVVVYTDASWDITIALQYDSKTSKFGFTELTVKHKYDGKETTFTFESLPKEIKKFIDLLNKAIDLYHGVKTMYRELTGEEVKEEYGLKVDYPNIQFSGKWGWEEASGTLCKYPVTISLKLDPLIGFTYKKDILAALMNKWPGIGTFINYIRSKVSESVELKIDFEIKGKIVKAADIAFVLDENADKGKTVHGSYQANTSSLTFTLTGQANVDILTVQCGAAIEGSTSFSIEFVRIGADEKGAYVQFPVTFSGLEVKGMIYSGTVSDTQSGEPRRRGGAKAKFKKEKPMLKIEGKKFFEDKIYSK